MKKMNNRFLITLLLASSLIATLGTVAHAAGSRWNTSVSSASKAPKPGAGPLSGEPDTGQGGPLPPKTGNYTTSNAPSSWAKRVQWSVRVWLDHLPKRLP